MGKIQHNVFFRRHNGPINIDVNAVYLYEVWLYLCDYKCLLKQEIENHIATLRNDVCVMCGFKCDAKYILTLHM